MSAVLKWFVEIMAKIHNFIMGLNNRFGWKLSDKQLHFIVIGLIGMGILFVVFPLFKKLAEKDHILVISWIYVFTLIIVITFAIEIGQKITGTGNMEFNDIVAGVAGFLLMFFVFALVRAGYLFIREKIADGQGKKKKKKRR